MEWGRGGGAGKTAGTESCVEAVTPDCKSQCGLPAKNSHLKQPLSLKNICEETVKSNRPLTLCLFGYYIYGEMGCTLKILPLYYWSMILNKSMYVLWGELCYKLNIHETLFWPGRLAHKLSYNLKIGRYFLRTKSARPFLQGKQLLMFQANDQIFTCRQN